MTDPDAPQNLVHLSNDALRLSVAALGAETQSLQTAQGAQLLWHGDATFWTGRAPVLFPIVGRAPQDRLAFGDHSTEMNQHGFARRSVFTLDAQSPTSCTHVLRATEATRAVYPFDFVLSLTHTLDANTLRVTAAVENAGETPMPFALGFHPAFVWPLPGAQARPHHVTLAHPDSPMRRKIQDGLLEDALIPGPFDAGRVEITEDLFAEGAQILPNGADALRYGVDGGPGLSFSFDGLPDLALWKPADAPFLCIEPWQGTPALIGKGPQMTDRPNTLTLAPGDARQFSYAVRVDL